MLGIALGIGLATLAGQVSLAAQSPVVTRVAGESLGAEPASLGETGSIVADTGEVLALTARSVAFVQTRRTSGTAFVVADGLMLTAAHVIGDASEVDVRFHAGARRTATVAAVDPKLDLAVLAVPRIPASAKPLDWQRADAMSPGEQVYAWGYPLEASLSKAGFSHATTLSSGVISAPRERDGVRLLQTDAAIGVGNSGGPLVTVSGAVVGVVVLILTPDGSDPEGLNFALDVVHYRDRVAALVARASRTTD